MINVRLFQIITLVSVLALLSLLAVACGSDPTSEPAPEATAVPATTEAMEPTAMAEEPEPTEAMSSTSGSDEPTEEPTRVPTPTPAPTLEATSDEVFELKFSSPLSPPPFLMSEVQKWWADEVERRSNGQIEWTDFYWSGALTKAGETLEAVEVGLADAGAVIYPYYPGKLPLGNWTYAVPLRPRRPACDPGSNPEVVCRGS